MPHRARAVTRRDFLEGVLLGTGAVLARGLAPPDLLGQAPPPARIAGDSVVGGNPRAVVEAAHRLRAGEFEGALPAAGDTGETYDLIVVGAGVSGLAAAHLYRQRARVPGPVLLLENHAEPGGNARSECFEVEGRRLWAGQGSAYLSEVEGGEFADFCRSIRLDPAALEMPGTGESWFFEPPGPGRRPAWVADAWQRAPEELPLAADPAADLAAWLAATAGFFTGRERRHYDALESLTYGEYLGREKGWGAGVLRWADCHTADNFGVTAGGVSARAALSFLGGSGSTRRFYSLPGGNGGVTRLLVAALLPGAVDARSTLGIAQAPVDAARLDVAGAPVRLRLGATVVRVEHEGRPAGADRVRVCYLKDGLLWCTRARAVIVASGNYAARRFLRDLPAAQQTELRRFEYAAYLVANVAVRHSRMLDAAGIGYTGYWTDGFGTSFCVADRPGMAAGARPAHGRPNVLTLYAPRRYAGKTGAEQGHAGRAEILATPFADYEKKILVDLDRILGPWGLDVERDVAAIALYRWGHAMVIPYPGFSHPLGAEAAPCAAGTRPFGRVAFAHTDRAGMPYLEAAVANAGAAVAEILKMVK